MKKMVVLVALGVSGFAFANASEDIQCVDFSGTWSGQCVNPDNEKTEMSVILEQTKCERLRIIGADEAPYDLKFGELTFSDPESKFKSVSGLAWSNISDAKLSHAEYVTTGISSWRSGSLMSLFTMQYIMRMEEEKITVETQVTAGPATTKTSCTLKRG